MYQTDGQTDTDQPDIKKVPPHTPFPELGFTTLGQNCVSLNSGLQPSDKIVYHYKFKMVRVVRGRPNVTTRITAAVCRDAPATLYYALPGLARSRLPHVPLSLTYTRPHPTLGSDDE
jgi:hypothetical protein